AGRAVWITGVAFVAIVVAATFYGLVRPEHYRFLTHLVTAAKFAEYAVLAPAVPLLLRARRDVAALLWSIAAWSAAATAWGLLQFSGLVNEFEGKRPLQREPSFLGIGHEPKKTADVESSVHRSLLAYIGVRIFADHPLLGVGWQGSEEQDNYRPYLAAAHRRFPGEPEVAFPSPQHAWGVQNAYLQTLTDMGLVGFALLVALFVSGLVLGLRAAVRGPPELALLALVGLSWMLVA